MSGTLTAGPRGSLSLTSTVRRNVKALALDPTDPKRVYAATILGLLVTTDGGDTWSMVADDVLSDSRAGRVATRC